MRAQTITEWLVKDLDGSSVLFEYIEAEGKRTKLAAGELLRKSLRVAGYFQTACSPGERVAIFLPLGVPYVVAFLGSLLSGAIPVPGFPPKINQRGERIAAILHDASPRLAVVNRKFFSDAGAAVLRASGVAVLYSETLEEADADWRPPLVRDTDIAFLQYTSGSTMKPRGVVVTHGNLVHNTRAMQSKFNTSRSSHMVSWLPAYHDMGLILGILHPLLIGFPATLMTPQYFLQRPLRWLETISEKRATISGAPNFAYDLCVQRVSAGDAETIQLDSWETAFNGAEQVAPRTLRSFAEKFAANGFKRTAFHPCYGLAEHTLMASGHTPGNSELISESMVRKAHLSASEGRSVVNCGSAIDDSAIAVVDPATRRRVPTGATGEVWLSGPSVASGYWNNLSVSNEIFRAHIDNEAGDWLRTGDLGLLDDAGHLYLVGRLKEVIVVNGAKHYPQDIEATTAGSHHAINKINGCAAFAEVSADVESLVVVAEIERSQRSVDLQSVIRAIVGAVSREHLLAPRSVVLIAQGRLPKTSSGKIQRSACASLLGTGEIEALAVYGPLPGLHATASPALQS